MESSDSFFKILMKNMENMTNQQISMIHSESANILEKRSGESKSGLKKSYREVCLKERQNLDKICIYLFSERFSGSDNEYKSFVVARLGGKFIFREEVVIRNVDSQATLDIRVVDIVTKKILQKEEYSSMPFVVLTDNEFLSKWAFNPTWRPKTEKPYVKHLLNLRRSLSLSNSYVNGEFINGEEFVMILNDIKNNTYGKSKL